MKKPKIAVFIPDYFWSSIPYDGLILYYHLLTQNFNVDLIMFGEDIRLNKEFNGQEKFAFNPTHFKKAPTLISVKNWGEFAAISRNYTLIVTGVHLAPKNRAPEDVGVNIKKDLGCPIMVIDIGGSDIISVGRHRGTYFCVKGKIWKDWLTPYDVPEKNIFITGSPHYDPYQYKNTVLPDTNIIKHGNFRHKYNFTNQDKLILIAPCNPASHQEQFDLNLQYLMPLQQMATKKGYKLIIKTYPHDYIFREFPKPYSGLYKRAYSRHRPQYEILQEALPEATIIESQDHFAAMLFSDKLFNISGSHLAWETCFCNLQSYSINYEHQPYYSKAAYLAPFVKLPDEFVNINIDNIEQIFDPALTSRKHLCHNYIETGYSIPKITEAISIVLKNELQ